MSLTVNVYTVSHRLPPFYFKHVSANLKGSSHDTQPKVKNMVDSLSMISSSTRILQLEPNHPDIGGEWSIAWAVLKHHHSHRNEPLNVNQYQDGHNSSASL